MGELFAKGWAEECKAAQLVVCNYHLRTGQVLDCLLDPGHVAVAGGMYIYIHVYIAIKWQPLLLQFI